MFAIARKKSFKPPKQQQTKKPKVNYAYFLKKYFV